MSTRSCDVLKIATSTAPSCASPARIVLEQFPRSPRKGFAAYADAMAVIERRGGGRPHPGELKVCEKCFGIMQFTEQYERGPDRAMQVTTAAWVCLSEAVGPWIS